MVMMKILTGDEKDNLSKNEELIVDSVQDCMDMLMKATHIEYLIQENDIFNHTLIYWIC